jgi:hypothetical protein
LQLKSNASCEKLAATIPSAAKSLGSAAAACSAF